MENNRNTQKHFFSLKMMTKVMRIKINATPNDECWLTFRSTSWAFSRCFSTNRSVWIRVWITFWASSGEKELVFLSSCLHKSSTCLLKLLDYEEKQTLCSHVYSWKDSINRCSCSSRLLPFEGHVQEDLSDFSQFLPMCTDHLDSSHSQLGLQLTVSSTHSVP